MKWNAIFGGAVWGVLAVAGCAGKLDLNWIELLSLFAPLVIVPLGMELTRCMEPGTAMSTPERVARGIQIPAAGLALAAFFCAPGHLSAWLAGGWLAFCGLLAIGGVIRFVNGAYMRLDSACAAIAFILHRGGRRLVGGVAPRSHSHRISGADRSAHGGALPLRRICGTASGEIRGAHSSSSIERRGDGGAVSRNRDGCSARLWDPCGWFCDWSAREAASSYCSGRS